ncbi:MAG: hypothetical protein WCP97_01760 [bacterium]
MDYSPELFYFFDQEGFPTRKAVTVTAIAVASFCSYYYANVFTIGDVPKEGKLPQDSQAREKLIESIISWIYGDCASESAFGLHLWEKHPDSEDNRKFDHPDDTCCWGLELTDSEFKAVQDAWVKNDLPLDLFYPTDSQVTIEVPRVPPTNVVDWCFRKLFKVSPMETKKFSPKQWEIEKGTNL